MTARVLTFTCRAVQLELRGRRNFSRYMQASKGYVAADGPRRKRWQRESAEDSRRDAEWSRHHGPVTGGATICQWPRRERGERQARPTSKGTSVR